MRPAADVDFCDLFPPAASYATVTQQALHGDDLQVEYGSAGLPLLRGGKAAQPECALEQEVAGVGSYSVAAAVGAEPLTFPSSNDEQSAFRAWHILDHGADPAQSRS